MRNIADIFKSPTHKELRIIEGLYNRMFYGLTARKQVSNNPSKRVLVSRSTVNELPNGKYEAEHPVTKETFTLAILDTKVLMDDVVEDGITVFKHPDIFPRSTIYVYVH